MNTGDNLFPFLDLLGTIFKQAFSFYQQYSDLRTNIIAAALGVNPIVVTIISYVFLAIPIIGCLVKVIHRK